MNNSLIYDVHFFIHTKHFLIYTWNFEHIFGIHWTFSQIRLVFLDFRIRLKFETTYLWPFKKMDKNWNPAKKNEVHECYFDLNIFRSLEHFPKMKKMEKKAMEKNSREKGAGHRHALPCCLHCLMPTCIV